MDNIQLKKRMYVFVERHLSPIDKGIQASHAVMEYYNELLNEGDKDNIKLFNEWSMNDKTLILLDGGNVENLKEIVNELQNNDIKHGVFCEPDLQYIITAVAVLVDEKVYNTDKYPEFDKWEEVKHLSIINDTDYVKFIGTSNILLRRLINNKHLAR